MQNLEGQIKSIMVFLIVANTTNEFSFIESFTGTNEPNKLTCSQLSGFVAQLAEHCTGIAEANFPFVNGRCHFSERSLPFERSMPFITVDYTLHFKEN